MTKLAAACLTLTVLVVLTLLTAPTASSEAHDYRLVVALPTASGGAQQLELDAIPGAPIQISNLSESGSSALLPSDGYRISGTWSSDDTLELDVFVAETVSFRDTAQSVAWEPERELRHHRLSVQRSERFIVDALKPAPGGVPQAQLIVVASDEPASNSHQRL